MDYQLSGKLALISGSTKGMAGEGVGVIVNGRTDKAVGEAQAEISKRGASGAVEGFAGDLRTAEAAQELARRFPAVDIW